MRLILNYKNKINGDNKYEVQDCDRIAWDGCHKIYLITTQDQAAEAFSYGYHLLDVSEIWRVYEESCPLRFIDFWDVENIKHPVIPQCEDGEIEIDGNASTITITVNDPDAIDEFINAGELVVYTGV